MLFSLLLAADAAGRDLLQPTPTAVLRSHAAVVDTCMTSAAKGAAWFVMAVCVLEALVFYGLAQTINKRFRGFHIFSFLIMLVPAIAYVTMLSGYGLTTMGAPFGHRCFFDARQLAMSFEMPLLVVAVGLLAGAHAVDITLTSIAAFLMQICMLMGGTMDSNNRWFLFLFAVLFSVPLLRCLWNKFGVTSGGEVIHEYSDLVATKVSWICNAVLIYLLTQVVFWVLCQGANVISPATELLILGIVDIVFISAFCISLISDRETVEKMAEYNSRGMGWLRGGGSSEYSSIEERPHAGLRGH